MAWRPPVRRSAPIVPESGVGCVTSALRARHIHGRNGGTAELRSVCTGQRANKRGVFVMAGRGKDGGAADILPLMGKCFTRSEPSEGDHPQVIGPCLRGSLVKDTIVARNVRATDDLSVGPDLLWCEPHGRPCVAAFSWCTHRGRHSPARVRHTYAHGVPIDTYRLRTLAEYDARYVIPAWAAGTGCPAVRSPRSLPARAEEGRRRQRCRGRTPRTA